MSRLRIRTLKPEFFQDEKIVGLSVPARYVAVGLVTLADDRGRQRYMPPSILGHVFPTGDVKPSQVERHLHEIVASGFALAYEAGVFSYLWLPNFWRHQVINRPTESELPPHTEDPYASLPVHDAIKAYRCESSVSNSLSDHGGLTPSRAGARSVPFLSSSEEALEETAEDHARKPKSAKPPTIDQDVLPDELGADLHETATAVLTILAAVHAGRGGNVPGLRGVGLALVAFPKRDHVGVARELEHWAMAGNGSGKPIKDLVRTFRTFLERSPDATPTKLHSIVGQPASSKYSDYDRAAGL